MPTPATLATQRSKTKQSTRPPTSGSWKKGQSGNPTGLMGLPPEKRAALTLELKARSRIIDDIAVDLKRAAALASDVLVSLVADPNISAETKLAAANSILNRVYGMPTAKVQADVNLSGETRVITPEEVRSAALRLAARDAEPVEAC